jgi:hypothetical protein
LPGCRPKTRSELIFGRHQVVHVQTPWLPRLRLRLRQPFRCRFTDNGLRLFVSSANIEHPPNEFGGPGRFRLPG